MWWPSEALLGAPAPPFDHILTTSGRIAASSRRCAAASRSSSKRSVQPSDTGWSVTTGTSTSGTLPILQTGHHYILSAYSVDTSGNVSTSTERPFTY